MNRRPHPNATPSQPVNGSPCSCPLISRINFVPKTKFYWGKGVEKFNVKGNAIIIVIKHTSLLAKLTNQLLYLHYCSNTEKGSLSYNWGVIRSSLYRYLHCECLEEKTWRIIIYNFYLEKKVASLISLYFYRLHGPRACGTN